jgi:hypothetical protein
MQTVITLDRTFRVTLRLFGVVATNVFAEQSDATFVAVPLRLRFSRCLPCPETPGSGH